MRYLLDTNIISDAVERRDGPAARKIRKVFSSVSLITSIIVVSELRYGYTKIASMRLKEGYEVFFDSIAIENWEVPFDRVYGEMRAKLERTGKSMGAMDMLIAAHALATDAVVVTDDRAFAHVLGLKVENWLRHESAA